MSVSATVSRLAALQQVLCGRCKAASRVENLLNHFAADARFAAERLNGQVVECSPTEFLIRGRDGHLRDRCGPIPRTYPITASDAVCVVLAQKAAP